MLIKFSNNVKKNFVNNKKKQNNYNQNWNNNRKFKLKGQKQPVIKIIPKDKISKNFKMYQDPIILEIITLIQWF